MTESPKRMRRRNRMKECEEKLAAAIRQYFRASRDSDHLAVRLASQDICTYFSWLLSEHLKRTPQWDSDERWIDGLISTKVSPIEGAAVEVEGEIVWGLSENPGGNQWSEPFHATAEATATSIKTYRMDFATEGKDAADVSFGFYPILDPKRSSDPIAASKPWRFSFHGPSPETEQETNNEEHADR